MRQIMAIVDKLDIRRPQVLVQAINVEEATGLLAARYAPERHRE